MLLEKVSSIYVSCKDTEKHRDTHSVLIMLDICLKVSRRRVMNKEDEHGKQ